MNAPDDWLDWLDWLEAEHPDAHAEQQERTAAASGWAQARREPLRLFSGRNCVAKGGMTPAGPFVAVRLRESDVTGMIRFASEDRPRPPAAIRAADLFDGPAHRLVDEPTVHFGGVLWWPPEVQGPRSLPARSSGELHALSVADVIAQCRRIPPGHHRDVPIHQLGAQRR